MTVKPLWKLLPAVAALAVGIVLALSGGDSARPQPASAEVIANGVTSSSTSINSGDTTTINVRLTPVTTDIAVNADGADTQTLIVQGCSPSCPTDQGVSGPSVTVTQDGVTNVTLSLTATCTLPTQIVVQVFQGGTSQLVVINCAPVSIFATLTPTPAGTATPVGTATPTPTVMPAAATSLTITPNLTTMPCNASNVIRVSVLSGSLPAPDGTLVTLSVSGGGVVGSSALPTINGQALFTYSAPGISTTARFTASVSGLSPVSRDVPVTCATIPTPAPPPPGSGSTQTVTVAAPTTGIRPPSTGDAGLVQPHAAGWPAYALVLVLAGPLLTGGAFAVARRRS